MENVRRIKSFEVNHDLLEPGIYISRVDGDVTTFDMRTRKPNCGDYMDNITMHSLEHMFATYIRNSAIGDSVIYFGPMGCRTGFYLLTRGLEPSAVLGEVIIALGAIVAHEGGVFGATRKECGNYLELDITAAKTEAKRYLAVLESRVNDFTYPTEEAK